MVTLNLYFVAALVVWLAIGGVFAYKLAISATAVVVLLITWPIFLLLIVLAYPINHIKRR